MAIKVSTIGKGMTLKQFHSHVNAQYRWASVTTSKLSHSKAVFYSGSGDRLQEIALRAQKEGFIFIMEPSANGLKLTVSQ